MGVSVYKMREKTILYNPADGDPSTWVNGQPPQPQTQPSTETGGQTSTETGGSGTAETSGQGTDAGTGTSAQTDGGGTQQTQTSGEAA